MRNTRILCGFLTAGLLCLFAGTGRGAETQNPFKLKADAFTPEEIRAAKKSPDFFRIVPESVRIVELPAEKPGTPAYPANEKQEDPFVIIDKILNIVERIWAIIEANKPVVDINTQYANAVPQGITHWSQLSEWKPPETKTYGFYAKNPYGVNTVEVKYQVTRTYGGNYKGKGQYLTGVTVNPLSVNVLWGYRFSLAAEVPDSTVMNVGTSTDPVAALQLVLAWRISTVLQSTDGRGIYYMQGDGYYKEMGSAFRVKPIKIQEVDAAKPLLEGVVW